MSTLVLEQSSSIATPPRRRHSAWVVVGLLAVVLVAHGAALFDGLFFDDYWQRSVLPSGGWNWQDLVSATTFAIPGPLNSLWWQDQPLQIRYPRPAAMVLMKVEFLLTGGNPMALHACGLLWHLLTGLLVYRLACVSIDDRRWAFGAAALFLINPHSVVSVGWIAAHNAVFSGFFMVAAVLAYIRASKGPALGRGVFIVSLLLWGTAVLCRESAIVLPLLAVTADLSTGGWAHLQRRLRPQAAIWLLAGAYVIWRLIVFPQVQLPQPYFHSPDGIAYLAWAAGKMVRLLVALVFYTPMLSDLSPAGDAPVQAVLTYTIMAALLLALVVWYRKASWGMRGRAIWPVWTVVAFVPVVPVIMLPHFAYASAVGWSIMLAILLSSLRGRKRGIVTGLAFGLTLWSLCLHRMAWRGIVRSEQIVYADLLTGRPPDAAGSMLFFINWPMAGVYAPAAARETWGKHDVEGCVLTFAPSVLRSQQPCAVNAIGPNELLVSMAAPGYFSGSSGKMLLDLTRRGRPLESGRRISGGEFDALVLDATPAGVTKIKFTFRRPLDSPEYHFYVSSPQRPALPLRFDAPVDAGDLSRQARNWRQANACAIAEADRYFALMSALNGIVHSDVFLTGDVMER